MLLNTPKSFDHDKKFAKIVSLCHEMKSMGRRATMQKAKQDNNLPKLWIFLKLVMEEMSWVMP